MANTPVRASPGRDETRISSAGKEDAQNTDSTLNSSGVGGDDLPEINVQLNKYTFEENISTTYPGTIVVGRDRASLVDLSETGYGLDANTECRSVDLVVGRKACIENYDISKKANPDFKNDAARIYISNRSNIDQYYAIPDGRTGESIKRSSVSAKADAVRLIGRECIKLVVGTDQQSSQREPLRVKCGVELMAGDLEKLNRIVELKNNREEQISEIKLGGMQPIPLGINTAFALDQAIDKIDKLAGVVSSLGMILNQFLVNTENHFHLDVANVYFGQTIDISPDYAFAANVTATDIIQYTIADIKSFRAELKTYKADHLKPSGAYYINSKHHTLN